MDFLLASQHGDAKTVNLITANGEINHNIFENMTSQMEVVCFFLDHRVDPKGEEGIYIKNGDGEYVIVMIEGYLCRVKNGCIDTIADEGIRAKFVEWQYRIGGEKYNNAVENLK